MICSVLCSTNELFMNMDIGHHRSEKCGIIIDRAEVHTDYTCYT